VPYVLPVNPIERYQAQVDDRGVPVPVVPEQDAGPWEAALRELLAQPQRYEQLSITSRAAAHTFLSRLSAEPFEYYLEDLAVRLRPRPMVEAMSEADSAWTQLSDERRRLLGRRLRRQSLAVRGQK